MWRVLLLRFGGLLAIAAAGFSSQANVSPPVDVVAARQESMDMSSITLHSMKEAIKAGREAKTQAYPATALAKWAKVLPTMFPQGTPGNDMSPGSQALNAVWQDPTGFDRAVSSYADATAKLAALATANDTAGFTNQLDQVNSACTSCHSRYKSGAQTPPKK